MKKYCLPIIISGFLASCNQDSGRKIREQVVAAAENYAMSQLNDAKRSVDEEGIITLFNDGIIYRIDPSKTVTGDLNGDSKKDAIISVLVSRMPIMDQPEHLILLNAKGDFIMAKVIDSEMKVIRIDNGVIAAEVSVISQDSPMYGCESCKEVVHYQFKGGELVRAEK